MKVETLFGTLGILAVVAIFVLMLIDYSGVM
jgi:hypothetical protein